MKVDTLFRHDTRLHADCVESCPIPGYTDFMVCGTYHLQKQTAKPDKRQGNIQLFQVQRPCTQLDCQDIGTGIFDIKWSHQTMDAQPVLALATASGTIDLWTIDETKFRSLYQTKANTSMYLSLDWNNRRTNYNVPSIAVSQSNGSLALWNMNNTELQCESEWMGHELYGAEIEVWITAFNSYNSNILLSGGDDGILKGWDRRMGPQSIFQNRRAHSMGVCSIQYNPHKEHELVTGSYDESIQLWDERQMKQSVTTFNTGGGVWRLKWHPTNSTLLLAACMHHGLQIFQLKGQDLERKVLYSDHESLAYGVDWSYASESVSSMDPIIGSCSFYDHVFHIWKASLI